MNNPLLTNLILRCFKQFVFDSLKITDSLELFVLTAAVTACYSPKIRTVAATPNKYCCQGILVRYFGGRRDVRTAKTERHWIPVPEFFEIN